MPSTDDSLVQDATRGRAVGVPKILYVCDFPPANRGGGDTLIHRLLGQWSRYELSLIFSSRRREAIRTTDLANNPYVCFPELTGARRHGISRILVLLDRLLIPLLTLWILWWIRQWRPRVLVTVAHGYMFIAAIAAGRLCGLPIMLIVHDDWVAMNQDVWIFRHITKSLFRWSLRHADHIYAVSPKMAEHLRGYYGVCSEVQWPGTSTNPQGHQSKADSGRGLRLVYAGVIYHDSWEAVDFLVRFLKTSPLGQYWDLDIFSNYSELDMKRSGWVAPNVHRHDWVRENDLKEVLAAADVLVLPIAFHSGAKPYATTSFPSKVADYLASGRAILVIAPQDSTTVVYLSDNRCAEPVCALDEALLSKALSRLTEPAARRALGSSALRLFQENHNIEDQRRAFAHRLRELSSRQTDSRTTRPSG